MIQRKILKLFSAVFLLLAIVVIVPGRAFAFAGGDGTSGDPYQISNCTELQDMNTSLSSYYILNNDVDCSATSGWNSGAGFVTIGNSSTRFSGNFNGAGYVVSDMFINRGSTDYIGMFGFTTTNATITDFGLTDVDITGRQQTGALIGYGFNTVIDNVYSTGEVNGTSTTGFTGGLIGRFTGASSSLNDSHSDATVIGVSTWSGGLIGETETAGLTITNSYATGNVTGTGRTGSLIGELSTSTALSRSYATGNVNGTSGVGALVGANYGSISDSYARGTTTGSSTLGGLVGYNYGTIVRSFATGAISGTGGGLLGGLYGGSCTDVFWDTETTGKASSSCGTGKTTAVMKDIATFTDTATVGLTTAWDFTGTQNDDAGGNDYWKIDGVNNDGYPLLNWQNTNANPDVPTSLGSASLVDGSWVNDNTPTLTFALNDTDVSDTVKYQIQIDDSSDFSSLVADYTSALAAQGSTSFTVGQTAGSGSYSTGSFGQTLSDGSYYWRVKAIDNSAAESSFSTANSGAIAFKADATVPATPGKATTSTPTKDKTPRWTWIASSDAGSGLAATTYTLQWSKSSGFSSGVSAGTSTTNSYTHSMNLSDGTWYVRQLATDNANNNSSYSTAGSVVIDNTAPSKPGQPSSLSEPSDNTPKFAWTASSDSGVGLHTTPYTIEWSKSSNFSSAVNSASSSSASFTMPSSLSDGTWYIRVKAKDVLNNTSAYSVVRSIQVDKSSSSTEYLFANSDLDLGENIEDKSPTAKIPVTHTVSILVEDINGNPIEGAKVTLFSIPRVSFTNQAGIATFSSVESGTHRAVIEYGDFIEEKSLVLSDNASDKEVNAPTSVNIKIPSETVSVSQPNANTARLLAAIAFILAMMILLTRAKYSKDKPQKKNKKR